MAEDVTQEVFMALIRDPKRFDPARGTLGGFLFGVARNHLRKRWEQDRRLVAFDGDPDDLVRTHRSWECFQRGASGNGAHGNGNGHGTFATGTSWDEFRPSRPSDGCGRRWRHCRRTTAKSWSSASSKR